MKLIIPEYQQKEFRALLVSAGRCGTACRAAGAYHPGANDPGGARGDPRTPELLQCRWIRCWRRSRSAWRRGWSRTVATRTCWRRGTRCGCCSTGRGWWRSGAERRGGDPRGRGVRARRVWSGLRWRRETRPQRGLQKPARGGLCGLLLITSWRASRMWK